MVLTPTSTRAAHWTIEAACRGADPEIFFPPPGRSSTTNRAIEKALSYCRTCPVRTLCLEEALRAEAMSASVFRAGIFGGTTAVERAMIARSRRLPTTVRGRPKGSQSSNAA